MKRKTERSCILKRGQEEDWRSCIFKAQSNALKCTIMKGLENIIFHEMITDDEKAIRSITNLSSGPRSVSINNCQSSKVKKKEAKKFKEAKMQKTVQKLKSHCNRDWICNIFLIRWCSCSRMGWGKIGFLPLFYKISSTMSIF